MLTITFPKLSKPLQYRELINADELVLFQTFGYNSALEGHKAVRERYVEQRDGILATRIKKWRENGQGKGKKAVPLGGIACEIHHDILDKYHPFKMKGLKNALEALQKQATCYRFPNAWLEVYMDGVAQGSSGVVGWRDETPVGPHAVLCLGSGMVETKGNTIADSLCQKRKFTGSEKEFHATVSIFHELGHVFHQLKSPNHYFAMADTIALNSDGTTEEEKARNHKLKAFANYKKQDGQAFYEALKNWSRIIGGYCVGNNPNEFVAEYFAATKGAGIRFANAGPMLETYKALGGPDIL